MTLHKIFTVDKQQDFSRAVKTERHVYDYVFTDSKSERAFVTDLDKSVEVMVYAKLPKGFFFCKDYQCEGSIFGDHSLTEDSISDGAVLFC